MSYSFVVDVKDGKPSVDVSAQATNVPDGTFMISGHIPTGEPNNYDHETLTVTRYDDKGIQLAQAAAAVRK